MGDPTLNITDLLSQKRKKILEKWFEAIIASYPPETVKFLRKEKDRFANPVGRTLLEGTEAIFEGLIQGREPEKSAPFLDNIIRIRAVQDFSPSQAVDFILSLKHVVRKELGDDLWEGGLMESFLDFEASLDELVKISFNIYMSCREEINELRMGEMRNRTDRIMQRINSVFGDRESEPDETDDNFNRPT